MFENMVLERIFGPKRDEVTGCQPYAPAAFTPRKYSWYSFLLEDESTPRPQCGRKDYVNEKFQ
jgi:hypothetical protein